MDSEGGGGEDFDGDGGGGLFGVEVEGGDGLELGCGVDIVEPSDNLASLPNLLASHALPSLTTKKKD